MPSASLGDALIELVGVSNTDCESSLQKIPTTREHENDWIF